MRKLTEKEIIILKRQNCSARDWNTISVSDNFDTSRVQNVHFSGFIKIGSQTLEFNLGGGMSFPAGIYNATLHNVTIGNDCLIRNVREHIANYDIGDGSCIENVGSIIVDGESSFGNGVKVAVLNEAGGREIPIYDKLFSHLAYMITLYRHRPVFIEKVIGLIDRYVESVRSSVGSIGKNCIIRGVRSVTNVRFGNNSRVEGASRLYNCSVNSNPSDPVHIGMDVNCEDLIICSGSSIEDGCMMTRCFVGQACHFGHNYSASDSLFFFDILSRLKTGDSWVSNVLCEEQSSSYGDSPMRQCPASRCYSLR